MPVNLPLTALLYLLLSKNLGLRAELFGTSMSRTGDALMVRARGLRLTTAFGALGIGLACSTAPLWAQDASAGAGLRGAVLESEINEILLPGSQARAAERAAVAASNTGIPTPSYRPATASPLDSGQDADPDNQSGSSSARTGNAAPVRPLSTAAARERARRERANPGLVEEPVTATPAEQPSSETDPLSTGSLRTPVADAEERRSLARAEALNPRATALERGLLNPEENPYAPVGLRLGTFTVVPTLEQGLTWTSNADSSPGGSEAILSETTLRLNAASDWSLHAATGEAYGTFRKSLSGDEVSELQGGISGSLRLDLAHEYTALARLGYTVRPESASSPVIIAGVEDQPLRHTIDGSLGLAKDIGKLRLSATGEVTRDQYADAKLIGGGTLSQEERNATLATLRLRTGYQISPALTPFVEGEIGRRFYDLKDDSAGYQRSANRYALRAGVMVDLEEKLSGEASLGWITEDLDDKRLDSISGLALAASLDWSPVRGTTVSLDGSTIIEGTTDAGQSGSILYAGTVGVERQIRENLTAEAVAGLSWRDYSAGGSELTWSGQAGMTWWLNRTLGITGRARYESRSSQLPGRDYDATSVFLGMKMQR